MAIRRIFQTGFEEGQTWAVLDYGGNLLTSYPRTGCYMAETSSTVPLGKRINPPASALRTSFGRAKGGIWNQTEFFRWYVSGIAGAAGQLEYRRGSDVFVLWVLGASVASSTGASYGMTDNYSNWSFDLRISPSSACGWVYFWINGQPVFEFNGSTATASGLGITLLEFGVNGVNHYMRIDDWYIETTDGEPGPTLAPDRYFVLLRPIDQGFYSEWLGSDGNSASNYQLVDEQPVNADTDYVAASQAGWRDSYLLQNYTVPGQYSILAVIPIAVAKRLSIERPVELDLFLRRSGSDFVDSACGFLGVSYRTLWSRSTCDPATGGPWQSASGLEMGIRSSGSP